MLLLYQTSYSDFIAEMAPMWIGRLADTKLCSGVLDVPLRLPWQEREQLCAPEANWLAGEQGVSGAESTLPSAAALLGW